jgi:hypothetical protein
MMEDGVDSTQVQGESVFKEGTNVKPADCASCAFFCRAVFDTCSL